MANAQARNPAFLKPDQLSSIRNLRIRARLIVEGMIAGLHRSPYHGFSAEFLEYRSYQQGESTRYIDWRKFAKSDRTVVRLFEDETNLYAHLLLDKSGSMRFAGNQQVSKFDYAATLAASLAWILIRQRDAVGFSAFDKDIHEYLPPRSTNVQLHSIISRIEALCGEHETACAEAMRLMATLLKKRGLTIVLSDLLDDTEAIIKGLTMLRYKKQDLVLIRISDPQEETFDFNQPLLMTDLENGRKIRLQPDVARGVYLQQTHAHFEQIEAACRDLAIDYIPVRTDEPYYKSLFRIVRKREALF